MATIDHLPDEILEMIMANLSIVDRVRLERVCQRWQFLCRRTWRTQRTLSLDHRTWGFRDPESVKVPPHAVRHILECCGRRIRKVSFSLETISVLKPCVLEHVARLCPRLTHLHAGDLITTAESLQVLAECCQSLEVLELGPVISASIQAPVDGDAVLSAVFRKNQRLRCVFLRNNETITGTCLQDLNPQSVEQLAVMRCHKFNVLNMRAVLKFTNVIRTVVAPLGMNQHIETIRSLMDEMKRVCHPYLDRFFVDQFQLTCVNKEADRDIVPHELAEFVKDAEQMRIFTIIGPANKRHRKENQ